MKKNWLTSIEVVYDQRVELGQWIFDIEDFLVDRKDLAFHLECELGLYITN